MKENYSKEMIEKAKQTKSLEELIAVAKQAGIVLSDDEAKKVFEKTHFKTGALSDDELDDVAGGCGSDENTVQVSTNDCSICGAPFFLTGYKDTCYISIDGGGIRIVCRNCVNRFSEIAVKQPDISALQRICRCIVTD